MRIVSSPCPHHPWCLHRATDNFQQILSLHTLSTTLGTCLLIGSPAIRFILFCACSFQPGIRVIISSWDLTMLLSCLKTLNGSQGKDEPNSLAGAGQGLLCHPGSWRGVDTESQATWDRHVKPSRIPSVKLSRNKWNCEVSLKSSCLRPDMTFWEQLRASCIFRKNMFLNNPLLVQASC